MVYSMGLCFLCIREKLNIRRCSLILIILSFPLSLSLYLTLPPNFHEKMEVYYFLWIKPGIQNIWSLEMSIDFYYLTSQVMEQHMIQQMVLAVQEYVVYYHLQRVKKILTFSVGFSLPPPLDRKLVYSNLLKKYISVVYFSSQTSSGNYCCRFSVRDTLCVRNLNI